MSMKMRKLYNFKFRDHLLKVFIYVESVWSHLTDYKLNNMSHTEHHFILSFFLYFKTNRIVRY